MGGTTDRVWLITGASTGIGRALAEAVLAGGERVVATARDIRTLDALIEQFPSRAHAATMDVTDANSVHEAVNSAIDTFGQIDILVNNAGHGLIGALEELSDRQARSVLETNVFGVLNVLRAALGHLRRRRRGHIVQMSSVGGVLGNPGHALYATSKFALEGMSEALAGEVAPFGIGVTIVEPGPFRTDFAGRSMRFADPIEDYRDTPAGTLRARFPQQDGAQPNSPERAAQAIIQALNDEHPPLRLPLGPEAVERIREKLEFQLDELKRWQPVAVDTRY